MNSFLPNSKYYKLKKGHRPDTIYQKTSEHNMKKSYTSYLDYVYEYEAKAPIKASKLVI